MKEHPKISVVLPLYQYDEYLKEALDSILNQSFPNFELIIICDHPSDMTKALLSEYASKDSRIIVHYRDSGDLVSALNLGIAIAKGEYIARMDADDIACPNRLEQQVHFLEQHQEIGLCGTGIRLFGNQKPEKIFFPGTHEEILCGLLFGWVIAHPTVMIRKSVLNTMNNAYNPDYPYAEDYELWTRLVLQTLFFNMHSILLWHRIHPNKVGTQFQSQQIDSFKKITMILLKRLSIDPDGRELEIHYQICTTRYRLDNPIKDYREWLTKIKKNNRTLRIFPQTSLEKVLLDKWLTVCLHYSKKGLDTWDCYLSSDIRSKTNKRPLMEFILLSKCIIQGVLGIDLQKGVDIFYKKSQ